MDWIAAYSEIFEKNIIKPLQQLSEVIDFTLVLIGVSDFVVPGVKTDLISWSEETEVSNICACDIGIMPLTNTPWEKGKCGYKLIQYMACSLPVVASDVGVNSTIVTHGVNGYVVSPDSPNDWFKYLLDLLKNKQRSRSFGNAGRKLIEEEYCFDVAKEVLSRSLGKTFI